MASELIVQTLKGPTSGANANKVIVPSGQTLDINDWSPPAGTVVQVKQQVYLGDGSNESQHSSQTFTATGYYIDVTPTSADSKILVTFSGAAKNNDTLSMYIDFGRSIDGGSVTLMGTDRGIARMSVSTSPSYFHVNAQYLDSPNTTGTVRYEVYTRGLGQTVRIGENTVDHLLHVMEIAG